MHSRIPAVALAVLAGVALASLSSAQPSRAPEAVRDRAFWMSLKASSFALPEGDAAAAILEASETLLSSPDPVLRDDVAYGLAVAWIYRERKVDAATLRGFAGRLERRMSAGIGGAELEATLSRSFSALVLSIVAAADLREPIFDEAQYASVLSRALSNLTDERDLRGHVAGLGWIHAIAHTADLVKFLARSPRLTRADQGRIVEALVRRIETMPQVFAWGEDERIAAALRSLVVRTDFDARALDAWLARLPAEREALWSATPLDVGAYARMQNAKQVLRALFATLSAVPDAAPAVIAQRDRVLACLSKL